MDACGRPLSVYIDYGNKVGMHNEKHMSLYI